MSSEILIIDDNSDIRTILDELISDAGYKTRLAANFNQALSEIDKKLPDVAIIDVKLDKGDNDGIQLLDHIKKKNNDDPLKIFNSAIQNVKPNLEVRSRRVGGATYQVPVEVKSNRGQALALRWLLEATRKRKNKTMSEKIYFELIDAAQNKGSAIKKREDTHKMAESNKAFAHFRW